jgi:hypothetical protein
VLLELNKPPPVVVLDPNRPPPDVLLGANAPALLVPNAPVLLEPNELPVFEPNNDGLLAAVLAAFPKLGVLAGLDEPNRPPPDGLLPKALAPVDAPPPNGEFVLVPPPI